ncbi:iron-siderophore ABC transporter substrate-binding protein [Anaerolineae bacterium CFX9]|nr:iron-siderophore ABC transporter substrate-binding protein [Anaerolineae bacterium CFX9]
MNKPVFRYFLLAALALLAVVPALAQDSDTSAFPLTIEHQFGTITLSEAPQRVVSIGYNTQDALFALGVQPVAVRYWFGDQAAHGVFPWAEDEANGAQPVLLDMPEGVSFEAILALQPDLIVAVYSGISREEYDLLSQIAPTLAQPDGYGDFTIPWQVSTQFIGDALGKSEEAEALIADVETQFAALREQHPEFAGKTFVIANSYDGSYGYFTGEDPRSRFFTDLGFVVPDELAGLAGDDFYASISMERVDLLDQDLLVFQSVRDWAGGREGIESDPVLSRMPAMQEGRAVFIPPALDDAFQFQTVLSLPYFLEGIVPEIASAVNRAASTQCDDGFRAFEHAMGVSCIPINPQRVVVLDTGELDNALALGAPVVGAPVTDALQYQAYLSDQLDGITDIGSISEPSFEAILALAPDLIIGSKQRYEAIYPQLSAIAPTVFTESLRVPWQDNFRFHAAALGRTAEPLLADYEARVAELQAALGDALDSTTISIIRFRPGQVRLYLKSSYIGYILQDVGLSRPPSQDQDVFSAEISLEQVRDADADYIFITGYDIEDSERDTFLNSPLWQTLGAVQNGHVIEVNDDTWIAGLGVQAANLVLDDLFSYLTDVEPTIPNPVEALAEDTGE